MIRQILTYAGVLFSDITLPLITSSTNIITPSNVLLDHMKMKISEHAYIFDWHTFSGNVNVSYTPNANEQWDFQFGGKNTYSEGDAFGSVPMGGGNRNYALLGQATYSRRLSDKLNLNSGAKFEYSRFETANKSDDSQNLLIKSSDKDFNQKIITDSNHQLNQNF
ncbi:MAG: hypothetical protein ACLUDU_17225 [Butyricimonas faecihominis]